MDDYLTKPLQVAALTQVLERWSGHAPIPAPAARHAPAEAPPVRVDFSRLDNFRELDTDMSTARAIVQLFLADTPAQMVALARAQANGDTVALAALAHALRGSASNLGAVTLAQVCTEIETLATQGQAGMATQWLVDSVQAAWPATQDLLRQWAADAAVQAP